MLSLVTVAFLYVAANLTTGGSPWTDRDGRVDGICVSHLSISFVQQAAGIGRKKGEAWKSRLLTWYGRDGVMDAGPDIIFSLPSNPSWQSKAKTSRCINGTVRPTKPVRGNCQGQSASFFLDDLALCM